jgi:putative FmdB family regulatory protein
MPLYDYRCGNCGDFRAFRSMAHSSEPRACPVCHATAERVLSAPFLAGGSDSASPQNNARPGVSWRKQCGFGCSHSHHS